VEFGLGLALLLRGGSKTYPHGPWDLSTLLTIRKVISKYLKSFEGAVRTPSVAPGCGQFLQAVRPGSRRYGCFALNSVNLPVREGRNPAHFKHATCCRRSDGCLAVRILRCTPFIEE